MSLYLYYITELFNCQETKLYCRNCDFLAFLTINFRFPKCAFNSLKNCTNSCFSCAQKLCRILSKDCGKLQKPVENSENPYKFKEFLLKSLWELWKTHLCKFGSNAQK